MQYTVWVIPIGYAVSLVHGYAIAQLRTALLQGSAGVLQKPVRRQFGVYEADRRR